MASLGHPFALSRASAPVGWSSQARSIRGIAGQSLRPEPDGGATCLQSSLLDREYDRRQRNRFRRELMRNNGPPACAFPTKYPGADSSRCRSPP
jgi:hypothetical protein